MKVTMHLIDHSMKLMLSLIIALLLLANIAKGEGDSKDTPGRADEVTLTDDPSNISNIVLPKENNCIMEKEVQGEAKKGPRIPPLPISEMPDEWVRTLERLPGAGLKGVYTPVNVFGTIMYGTETMGSFLDYWVTSKLKMGLSGREQELVILRMGYLYNCNYVWKHHVPVAREYGVSDNELEAVKTTPLPSVFSSREYALLMLTNEMVEHRTIRDDAWSEWSDELEKSEMVDLISLVSQYVLFALLNNAIKIEIEEPLSDIPGL